MSTKETRSLHEVVELTRDCELGVQGERAVVIELYGGTPPYGHVYMTLLFPDRPVLSRKAYTGADYQFLRSVKSERF